MEEMHSSQTLKNSVTFVSSAYILILLEYYSVMLKSYSLAMNDDIWQFQANMNSAIFDL